MKILDLGRKHYDEVWELQKRLVAERSLELVEDTLILVEHDPVYTIGASSRQEPPAGLPHPLLRVERGGDLTYHGPGQLVGYPIVDLRSRGLRIRPYLRLVEDTLSSALETFGLVGERVRGFTGVWVRGKKLASIGVAVRGHVTYHGFALNVEMDLTPFNLIRPCLLEPEAIGTVAHALGRPMALDEMRPRVIQAFESRFPSVAPATA